MLNISQSDCRIEKKSQITELNNNVPYDKTKPEPDVSDQHDEANQEDEQDCLVVRRSAGLLYLYQSCIMHPYIKKNILMV